MIKKISKNTENSAKNASDNSLKSIKEDKSFQILKLAVETIKESYNLTASEILSLIEEKPVSKDILIPVSVFAAKLSALEVICKFLKEELEFSYSKIASLLNRDERTIWATYNNAIKKSREKLPLKEPKFFVPASLFANRKFSVLESLVGHLKEKFGLRYSEISILLSREQRNIWAIYSRYKKKKK